MGTTGMALCVGLGVLAGCTADDGVVGYADRGVPIGSFQLVAFDSCDEALTGLRSAAKEAVGPYGLQNGYGFGRGPMADVAVPAPAPAGAPAEKSATGAGAGSSTPDYSGTNTHEAGVEEPDLVKTDGRRIVTVSGGVLRVVDAATRRTTGSVDITGEASLGNRFGYSASDLLLSGDRALVLQRENYLMYRGGMEGDVAVPVPAKDPGDTTGSGSSPNGSVGAPDTAAKSAPTPTQPTEEPVLGPRLVLVDLSGPPRVISSLRIDGGLVDARQVAATARVVIRSSPRITFPYLNKGNDSDRLKANRGIIDQAGIEQWLPRLELTTGGSVSRPTIGCDAVVRPDVYSGMSLLTVLTFDLGADSLGDGRPLSLVADGDTVYSNGASLYVSSDQRWRAMPMIQEDAAKPQPVRTVVYKFDTSTPDRPKFVAGGSVDGYLVNQYAMSEWDGNLRVATTTGETWAQPGGAATSKSGITVLSSRGRELKQVGRVDGLGKGERIYSVRFAGPIGYVVTFRQTDPLYTVDLSNPAKPAVRGQLKIPGYSSYLHPVGTDRLIGIGQDASDEGRVTGTQVSLFDVADLANPKRLATYRLTGANSEAEFDPHAFLYWPADGLLVVPLQVYNPATDVTRPEKVAPSVGALVLHVTGTSITEQGFLRHPSVAANGGYPDPIRRSLVIGQTLWTVSDGGLLANDDRTLARQAWIQLR